MPGTLNTLIVAYYKSAEYLHVLSPATQKYRRNIIERFRAPRGDRPVKLLEQRHVAAILEHIKKPHARKSWLKAIRGLMKYAVQIGRLPRIRRSAFSLSSWPRATATRLGAKPILRLIVLNIRSALGRAGRSDCCSAPSSAAAMWFE